MKEKTLKWSFAAIILLIVILLFAIIDYLIHDLKITWEVPDYYFRNKIAGGFLWGVVGLLLSKKVKSIWLKAAAVAGAISVALQARYFLEGYALDFVLIFLLIHFIILYFLSMGMFWIFSKNYQD